MEGVQYTRTKINTIINSLNRVYDCNYTVESKVLNMNTIIIKDDKDLLKVKKGDKVIDQRLNKEVDLEVSRHWYEYNE